MHSQTGGAEQLGPPAQGWLLFLCCINPAHMIVPGCHEKLTTVPLLKPGQCPNVKDPFSSFQAGEISVLFLVLCVFSFMWSFRHLLAVWEEPPHQGPPFMKPPLYEVLTQNPKPCRPRTPSPADPEPSCRGGLVHWHHTQLRGYLTLPGVTC